MAHRVRRRHLQREQTLSVQTPSAESTFAPSAEMVLAQARHVGHHFARMNQTAAGSTALARKPRQGPTQEVRREAEPDTHETASPAPAVSLAYERESVANREVSRETVYRDAPAGAPPVAAIPAPTTAAPTTIVRSLFETSVVAPLQQAHDLIQTPDADEAALQTASNKMNVALNSLVSLQAPVRAQKDESQLMRVLNLSNLVSTYQQHIQTYLGNTMPVRQIAAQISPLSGPMHARIARINTLLREAGKPQNGSAADPQVAFIQAMFQSGVVAPLHTAHTLLLGRKPDVSGAIDQEMIAVNNLTPLPGVIRGVPEQAAAPEPAPAPDEGAVDAADGAKAQSAPANSSDSEAAALVFEDLGTLAAASVTLLQANTGEKIPVEDIAKGIDPQGGGDVNSRITGIEAGFDALDVAATSGAAPMP